MSAANRGTERNERDFYATPIYAIDLILNEIRMDKIKSFCEPCRGDGRIYDKINVRNKSWYEIRDGKDYLKAGVRPEVDLIVANPPYSHAREFIDAAIWQSTLTIMLLRLNFLGAQSRREWWQIRQPFSIYVLSERPKFTINKKTGKPGSDATEYGWFCWGNQKLMKRKKGIHIL